VYRVLWYYEARCFRIKKQLDRFNPATPRGEIPPVNAENNLVSSEKLSSKTNNGSTCNTKTPSLDIDLGNTVNTLMKNDRKSESKGYTTNLCTEHHSLTTDTNKRTQKSTKERNTYNTEIEGETQIKYKELRQLEAKLKKREEEIRLREMRNAELNNENVRLQSTVQQQEAKIEEFQHTIRILNRKIVVLEDTKLNRGIQDNETPSTKCNNKPTNETDQLVLAMRDRMTKLVLKRVDEQIKLMEDDSEISTRNQGRRINNNNYHIQSENTSTYDRDQQHKLHTQQQSASYPCRNIQDIHEPIINAQTIPTA